MYYGGWEGSKIVNGFFASKGPAHGKRKMRGIMFVSSLESRGDGAGGGGGGIKNYILHFTLPTPPEQILFSLFPCPPTETTFP